MDHRNKETAKAVAVTAAAAALLGALPCAPRAMAQQQPQPPPNGNTPTASGNAAGAATGATTGSGSSAEKGASAAASGSPANTAAANSGTASNTQHPVSAADQEFMRQAAIANLSEIQEATLALKHTKDPQVKALARRMVSDHRKAEDQLAQVAAKNNYKLPAHVDPDTTALLKNLSKKSGADFDKAYIAAQVQDHDKTIDMFQQEVKTGNNLDVKEYAKTTVPTLAEHALMTQQIAKAIGVPATYGRPPAQALTNGATSTSSSASMPAAAGQKEKESGAAPNSASSGSGSTSSKSSGSESSGGAPSSSGGSGSSPTSGSGSSGAASGSSTPSTGGSSGQ